MEAGCGYLNSSATEYVNLINSSAAYLHLGTSFTALQIVLSIALAAVITFNGLIALVLLRATSVAITVRVPLMNLLVAALIAAVLLLCGTLIISVMLAQHGTTVLLLLPFIYLLCSSPFSFAQMARQLGLVVFSVVVFRTATCGTRRIGAKWLIFSMVTTWVIAILTTIVVYAPLIYLFISLSMYANSSTNCTEMPGSTEVYANILTAEVLAYMSMIAVVCIIFAPLLVCVCVIVRTLCYIKRHTISEGAQYKKALAKFAAFLITGNVLNVLDHIVNMAVALGLLLNIAVVTSQLAYLQWVYLIYIIAFLSFIPTPILIVVFLKPVRKRLCCLFCNKYRRDNETIPMQQAETPL